MFATKKALEFPRCFSFKCVDDVKKKKKNVALSCHSSSFVERSLLATHKKWSIIINSFPILCNSINLSELISIWRAYNKEFRRIVTVIELLIDTLLLEAVFITSADSSPPPHSRSHFGSNFFFLCSVLSDCVAPVLSWTGTPHDESFLLVWRQINWLPSSLNQVCVTRKAKNDRRARYKGA